MVTLTLWKTWDLTISDDLRVQCRKASLREWAQAIIDRAEVTDYVPDLAVYHAHRIAEYPGWAITKMPATEDVGEIVY